MKHCTILCRCCCRHFEKLKSLRYGMISLLRVQCSLTTILHNAVKFAAVKWTLLILSFVKQMATLCFGKKFVVRTVKALLPRFLKPIRKAMLLHRQMMGADGQLGAMASWVGWVQSSPATARVSRRHNRQGRPGGQSAYRFGF